MKIKAFISCIFIALLTSLFCFSSCVLLPTSSRQRAKMCSYYSNDDNYVEVSGTMRSCHLNQGNHIKLTILFDEESVSQNKDFYKQFISLSMTTGVIVGYSEIVLIDNGFYALFVNPDYETEAKPMPEEQVTIITCLKMWGDGWDPVIVSVKVGDTVYLDFETGKANLLDWVQNDMR